MILSLLKAYKSIFYPRSIIIATNGKNAIEAKRETNKTIFYNSFISFEILLNSFRLTINPSNEKNITKYKKSLPIKRSVKYSREKRLPTIKTINSNNLSLIIEYSNFNISNFRLDLFIISLYRLITKSFFCTLKAFCFYVVFNERFYPIRNFSIYTPHLNCIVRNIANFRKIFFSETSIFKQVIKFFFIHFIPLFKSIYKIISNMVFDNYNLTLSNYTIYNYVSNISKRYKGATKWKQQKLFQSVKIKQ